MKHRTAAGLAVSLLAFAALSGWKISATTQNEAAATPAPMAAVLPAADPALAPFAFMAGGWMAVNPNKSVNREHWSSPAGKSMSGAFQQLRRDASPGFYELSAIVAEKDGVVLYHRHLHTGLALDERRAAVDVFKLRLVANGKAVFVPAKDNPDGIETMTYRADGPDRLVQELVFNPTSKEKNFSTVYSRENK